MERKARKTREVQGMAKAARKTREDATRKVHVHHLSRVEGHGNIVAEIDEKGMVTACRWEVPEAPRFFEAMILGRRFTDVHQIVSRICGICAIGHQLASLQATEEALGVRISEQTQILRKLALHAENVQIHLLHIGYLVLPDLLGVPSVLPLAETHRQELLTLIGARRLSNDFSQMICGRTTHPQRLVPGGMSKLPSEEELVQLKGMLGEMLHKALAVVDLFALLKDKFPDFERPTEYVSLVSPHDYALLWGVIGSSKAERRPASRYRATTKEYCTPQSTAKWTRGEEGPYMVGALARFNLNAPLLSGSAKAAAGKLGLAAPCHNPYLITLAQLVEVVHSAEDSLALVESLLSRGVKPEPAPTITPAAGRGVGAVEVPRGILFHSYEYDDKGRIVEADCVIPTGQNHANIQADFDALLPIIAGLGEPEIELKLSMLVRAYDPCISCSTHLIDVRGLDEEQERRRVTFIRKK